MKPIKALVTVFLACSAFCGSLCPADEIIPIPPRIKKKRRISPATTKEMFKKRVTNLPTLVISPKGDLNIAFIFILFYERLAKASCSGRF